MGEGNEFGNAFTWTETPLRTEREAQRVADTSVARVWEIQSASQTNYIGKPTAYHLLPQPTALLMADPGSTRGGARRVRDEAPVGHGVRARRAVAGRPVPECPPGRCWSAGLFGR